MIKNLGDLLTRKQRGLPLVSGNDIANHYLATQFGWLPLIRDIQDLMDLQSHTMKRVRELNSLYKSPKGLRRRLQFESASSSTTTEDVLGLAGSAVMRTTISHMIVKNSWGTINWRPSNPIGFVSPSDSQIQDQAYRVVRGLTVEGTLKGAWDLIPWTWLLGWFTNVGKLALANSNTVPASHGPCCFMSQSRTASEISNVTITGSDAGRNAVTSSGVFIETRKTRVVSGAVVPGFNVPFLSTFRLSILAALGVQRIRGAYKK